MTEPQEGFRAFMTTGALATGCRTIPIAAPSVLQRYPLFHRFFHDLQLRHLCQRQFNFDSAKQECFVHQLLKSIKKAPRCVGKGPLVFGSMSTHKPLTSVHLSEMTCRGIEDHVSIGNVALRNVHGYFLSGIMSLS